ncbi:DUF2190 family protein [Nitratidesulfovibrio sp. 1201_IL3209]|uniref:DUF2190 family protein n=1 Tax=Nitratidesulfovibrio sp. 1201_IL3209 TaxID=3084053 RepID=UPI002FDA989D
MALNRIQKGDIIDYTNGGSAAIASGQVVVIGTLVGVALVDIAVGETGSVAIAEVFEVPKASGAISQGAAVYWDADGNPVDGTAGTGAATTTADGNTLAGKAFVGAASNAGSLVLLLNA